MADIFSGGGQGMTQTAIQDVPGWMRGPLKGMIATGEELVQEPYQPYEGPRIADFSPMQQQAFQGISGLPQFGQETLDEAGQFMRGSEGYLQGAEDYLGQARNQLMGSQQDLGQARDYISGSTGLVDEAGNYMRGSEDFIQGSQDTLDEAGDYARQAGRQWTDIDQSQYINPYVKEALDPTAKELRQEHGRIQSQIGQGAAQSGAFGGSRQGIRESMNTENLLDQVNQLYGQGYAQAYDKGQQAFGADRAAAGEAGAGLQNIAAGMREGGAGMRDIGAGMLQGATGMQAAGSGMLDTASRKQDIGAGMMDASTGMRNLGTGMRNIGGSLQGLAQTGQGMYSQGLQSLLGAGGQQQALDQAHLDTAYGDFQEQRDFPYGQLSYLSSLIRGVPQVGTTYQEVERPSPSENAQWLGAGLSGLGLMDQLGGMV